MSAPIEIRSLVVLAIVALLAIVAFLRWWALKRGRALPFGDPKKQPGRKGATPLRPGFQQIDPSAQPIGAYSTRHRAQPAGTS